jgi:peptidoglycan/xylan/chitin deacetylase (PgdA/CDA1 family)
MGPVEKPYFAVTFDDGYASLPKNAVEICETFGVSPTVFVCGHFADRTEVNFRILLAMLERAGERSLLREKFNQHLNIELPEEMNFLDFGKNYYQHQRMAKAVLDAWETADCGALPEVHMDWDQIRQLGRKGWDVGSHTLSHSMLGTLDFEEQQAEIDGNRKALDESGIPYVRWISYPYGAARHVNHHTLRWMEENRDWNGIFAKGGVNTFFCRTDWMRIGIGQTNIDTFRQLLQSHPGS